MHIEELPWVAPHELFHAFAHEPFALFLDSSSAGPDRDPSLHGRWSFIAVDPFDTLTLRCDETGSDPFAALSAQIADLAVSDTSAAFSDAPPFLGGAAGFFGYDLAQTLEKLPARKHPFAIDDQHVPDMAVGFYDLVLAFDHVNESCFLISTGLPEKRRGLSDMHARSRAGTLRRRLTLLQQTPSLEPEASNIHSNFTRTAYEQAVQRVIDYIRAGDIFQANLSQRFEAQLARNDTPYALYLRLRAQSPAPFASFFNFGDGCLLSSSPERFLLCTANGNVETKPIKGTRPRGSTETDDQALAAELLVSEKDRAENVMIVDLLRNDLSRTCEDHSVTVEKLCALESFSNVHHLVSTVRGQLREGKTALDLLSTCFPGGSITGAPKLRAMEIIAEIEPTTRGPYCGSIGYLGFNGAMDMAIAIRTMLVTEGHVTFQAGGGITADSNPATEYEETLAKARAMFAAVGAADGIWSEVETPLTEDAP